MILEQQLQPATTRHNLTTSTSNHPTSELPGIGAFNGTGLDIVPAPDVFDDVFMYLQQFSGGIRYSVLRTGVGGQAVIIHRQ